MRPSTNYFGPLFCQRLETCIRKCRWVMLTKCCCLQEKTTKHKTDMCFQLLVALLGIILFATGCLYVNFKSCNLDHKFKRFCTVYVSYERWFLYQQGVINETRKGQMEQNFVFTLYWINWSSRKFLYIGTTEANFSHHKYDHYRLKLSNNSDLCVSQYSPIVGQLKRRKKIYPVNVPKI